MVVKYPTISSGEVNLTSSEDDLDQERGGSLISFDVRDLSAQVLVSGGVTDVHVSMNKKIMVLEKSEKGYTAELTAYKQDQNQRMKIPTIFCIARANQVQYL